MLNTYTDTQTRGIMKQESIDKIVLMVKDSPLFPEDVKESVLNDIRTDMHWKHPEWKEPSLLDNNYLRSYYNNMFK